jgi:hypothetical protein
VDAGNGVVGWEVVSVQVKEESQIGEWFVLEACIRSPDKMLAHQESALEEAIDTDIRRRVIVHTLHKVLDALTDGNIDAMQMREVMLQF